MSRFYLNIILPSILSILLFILTIFLIIIPRFQQNIMNGKREMIKELTNSAWSILSKYENDEQNGLLTREEAQVTSVARIQYLRYGEENKDYFWITDMHPTMVMHPYRPELNGQDLNDFSDAHGKKMFVEFVKTVETEDHGYVDYMWQWKDDSLHIVPKLSYVRIFEPWGWVIGTGIYIEDVKKEIKALTQKLLWISVGISILIAFLLLLISRHSLKIEFKRITAENELHESREKYKTLVEAATDGLIMIIDGRISFSNSVISKLTGYENSELFNLPFTDLISGNNTKDTIGTFSKNIVKEGQFEINLKKKNGESVEVLITSSTASFFTNNVNIIIVKDISTDKSINLSSIDYQRLINLLNVGFFRAQIDSKGKFLFANETAVRMLGYDNFRELSEIFILKMLANAEDRKNLRNILLENGFIKNKVMPLLTKYNGQVIVSLTLIVDNAESSDDLICDGIIMDLTAQEKEKEDMNTLIAELKTNSFLLEQPVNDFITPAFTINSDSTITDVLKTLSIRKTDCLLLTKGDKEYIGIITKNDIQNRVISLDLHLENPAYLIMSSPVIYAGKSVSVSEAVYICESNQINHLVIRNETGEIAGILRMMDVYKAFKNSLSFYIENVKKADTDDDLKVSYRKTQLFIKPLIHSEISVNHITNITSSFSDAVIRRLIDLTIQEIGPPPVDFSFICLGSEGRKEETLFTDQDNAIIYEDVPTDLESQVNEYFINLGELVCKSLNHIGYSFCKGNIMAMNPQWCKPIRVWEKYFAGWISSPEPQNLLDATIFFDFRNIYGNTKYTDRLKKTINQLSKENSIFLYQLAYNTYNTKSPQISSSNIITDKSADNLDLKVAVNFIVMFARTYSLQNNIWYSNTLERLYALKAKHLINADTVDEIIFAYNFLMKLRFRNQLALSDNKMTLSNQINTKKLMDFELTLLKKILSQFNLYQSKISSDFRITT